MLALHHAAPPRYCPREHDTTPAFLVARLTPELSRSCRLAVDLPLLAVLTWLCGGARSPRRHVPTRDIRRRLVQILPEMARRTDRELGGSLRRIWRAGLAEPDERGYWRPRWVEHATCCRLDVAIWRSDLSPAAKRAHALVGPRIARCRHDSIRFLGDVSGMGRGRIGAALAELERAGHIRRDGTITRAGRSWGVWNPDTPEAECVQNPNTGTQPEGENTETSAVPGTAPGPKARCGVGQPQIVPERCTSTWRSDLLAALDRPGSMRDMLRIARVGAPVRPMTCAGRAGLARMVDQVAETLILQRTSRQTVVAFLLEQQSRGAGTAAAGAALLAAVGRTRKRRRTLCVELEGYVLRVGAERHVPDGPMASQVRQTVRDADRSPLRVGAQCGNSALDGTKARIALDDLDRVWSRVPSRERAANLPRYLSTRTWLLAEIDRCTHSDSSWTSTAGSRSRRA